MVEAATIVEGGRYKTKKNEMTMVANNTKKKKKSPGRHLLGLAALSAIIVYSYNSILEPLMFGDIEYGSASHKQMYNEDLRRVLTASGRAGEYERVSFVTFMLYD